MANVGFGEPICPHRGTGYKDTSAYKAVSKQGRPCVASVRSEVQKCCIVVGNKPKGIGITLR